MEPRLSHTSRWLSRVACAVFLLLLGVAVLVGMKQELTSGAWKKTLLCTSLTLLLGIPALYGVGRLAEWLGRRKSLLLLLGLCLVVKLAWVLTVSIEPQSDYATFYRVANELLEGIPLSDPLYVALFPHILGYSAFLSLVMRVFGTGTLVAALLNVALSLVSAAAIFYLGERLGGLRTAAGAVLLWSICPSQTIYNMYVLSDPLYTTLILLFLCLVVRFADRETRTPLHAVGLGALGGLLLAGINAVRPIAVILLIGLVLWLGLLQMKQWREKPFRKKWLVFLAALVAAWGLAGSLWNSCLTQVVGQEAASTPGFNLYVGLNKSSNGAWNAEDSLLMQEYRAAPEAKAVEIQEEFLDKAMERLTSGEINWLHLLGQKLRVFLWQDSMCVQYAVSILNHVTEWALLCNTFYHALTVLVLAAVAWMLKKGDCSMRFLPMVFVVGLTLAQLLVEVAGRYHYSVLPMFCILGAWLVARLSMCLQNRSSSASTEEQAEL